MLHDGLIGDWHRASYAALKAVALFATAVVVLRVTERRTLAELVRSYGWPR
ncbi:hypothetical protein [Modestobacter muralis]|uniref:hypothetical protein n=1 Tax=Modestobacter muralis TaxID=1608614 RepID=UPI001B8C5A41|nr:hypothetical protein [Modestobacter muralis]